MNRKIKMMILLLAAALILTGCTGAPQGKGPLKIGVSEEGVPPFSYQDSQRQQTGSDIELALQLTKAMGREAEFTEIPWSERAAALKDGTVDMLIGGLTIESEGEGENLTEGYAHGSLYLVALEGTTDFDPAGKKIAVLKESAAYYRFGLDQEFRAALGEWFAYGTAKDLFEGLEKGEIDYLICDENLKEYMAGQTGKKYAVSPTPLAEVLYVIHAGDETLRQELQKQLEIIDV